MALDLLGDGFDLHGGGQDLIFPHHENERAQAVAVGREFARHWVHNGMVVVGDEKMSKSVGNITNLLDLIESGDSRAYRLLVLQSHYRAPIEVTPDTVAAASQALARLDAFARRAAEARLPRVEPEPEALERFRAEMDDDLDTPAATALAFDLVRRANTALDTGDAAAASLAAAVHEICGALGIELRAERGDVSPEAGELARRRDVARAAREWAEADSLRDELVRLGYEVADTPEGTKLRRV
jgi:cysteinyl-tRNA synthetase